MQKTLLSGPSDLVLMKISLIIFAYELRTCYCATQEMMVKQTCSVTQEMKLFQHHFERLKLERNISRSWPDLSV